MAATGNNQKTGVTYRIFSDDAAHQQKNVAGGRCTLYTVFIQNAWTSGPIWLKLYDSVEPTFGTTAPTHIFRINNSGSTVREVFSFPAGLPFVNGLSYALVQTSSTAGTTAPGTSSPVRLITS